MMTVFEYMGGVSWTLAAETALNGFWPGAVLTALMWLVLRAVPWLNATTRYAIWCVTLLAVISLPFLPVRVAPPATGVASVRADAVAESLNSAGTSESFEHGDSGQPGSSIAASSPAALQIPERLVIPVFALWLLVSTILSLRLLGGYLRMRRLKREAVPLGAEYQVRLRHWLAACGIKRSVRVACARGIQMPLAAGLLDAVILIPEGLLQRLTEDEFDQILLHELAHIRRRDDWTFFLQKMVEAVLFFHPGILLIGRKLDLEREIACDDWVITLTGRRRHYATCLTRLIELKALARSHAAAPAPSVLIGRRHASRRVELLLDKKRNATPQLCKVGGMVVLLILGGMFSQFTRLSPAFIITRASEMRVGEPVADASTGQYTPGVSLPEDIYGGAVVGNTSEIMPSNTGSGQATAPAIARAGLSRAQVEDGVARMPGAKVTSPAPQHDARMSEADERAKHQYEQRVKELMEPRLREIQREATQAVRPEANELARLAHGLTFGKVHEIEMRGEKPSAEQMRRIQKEVDAALKDKMDALKRKVSAIADPETRKVERQARQQVSREISAERK